MVVDSDEEDRSTPLIDRAVAVASPPWSMVAIKSNKNHSRDNPTIVFPPANHENLHVCSDPLPIPPNIRIDDPGSSSSESDLVSDSDSNSSSTFSPWDSPLLPSPKASSVTEVTKRVESWTEVLRSKVYSAARFLWENVALSRGLFLTFRSAAATAVLVVAFLYFRQRRRLRTGEESRAHLIGIINEREEKINQLLDQISRMNQVLLALHRVPSTT